MVKAKRSWAQEAMAAVCEFADLHRGEDHVTETIRAYAYDRGVPRSADERAWGGVIKKAERLGIIRAAGFVPVKSSNGSAKVLWTMVGARRWR